MYQLRHKAMGIFQGSITIGIQDVVPFWHLVSDMPEQGLTKFHSIADANRYRSSLPYPTQDLTIEPFNQPLSDLLMTVGANKIWQLPDHLLIRYGNEVLDNMPDSKNCLPVGAELERRYAQVKEELDDLPLYSY